MSLDAVGRSDVKFRGFKGNLDIPGRVWTARRVLQNRRMQVRFLSHLPENPQFMGATAIKRVAHFVCIDPFDPNGSIACSYVSDTQLVTDVVVQ
jgi:hypothetical protein